MEKEVIQFTNEENVLLARLKEFHKTNGTPNRRTDSKNPVEIAIEGAKAFPRFSLRAKKNK